MAQLHTDFSKRTVQRVLAKRHITKWQSHKRPTLTSEIAKERLNFARKYQRWHTRWRNIIFSDKCSVERSAGRKQEWFFGTQHEWFLPQNVTPKKPGKDLSIIVSSCFSGRQGRSDLIVMERDPESRRNGYSARSYIKVLEEVIPQQLHPHTRFLQDNAKIHTALITMDWFEQNGVRLFTIPPYSPDINAIEHLWPHLKTKMHEIEPHLMDMSKSDATVYEMASRILPQAWEAIN